MTGAATRKMSGPLAGGGTNELMLTVRAHTSDCSDVWWGPTRYVRIICLKWSLTVRTAAAGFVAPTSKWSVTLVSVGSTRSTGVGTTSFSDTAPTLPQHRNEGTTVLPAADTGDGSTAGAGLGEKNGRWTPSSGLEAHATSQYARRE